MGGNSINTLRYLSTQTSGGGKDTGLKFANQNPKPIILPETEPSEPYPTAPYPQRTPIIEIPGSWKILKFLIFNVNKIINVFNKQF